MFDSFIRKAATLKQLSATDEDLNKAYPNYELIWDSMLYTKTVVDGYCNVSKEHDKENLEALSKLLKLLYDTPRLALSRTDQLVSLMETVLKGLDNSDAHRQEKVHFIKTVYFLLDVLHNRFSTMGWGFKKLLPNNIFQDLDNLKAIAQLAYKEHSPEKSDPLTQLVSALESSIAQLSLKIDASRTPPKAVGKLLQLKRALSSTNPMASFWNCYKDVNAFEALLTALDLTQQQRYQWLLGYHFHHPDKDHPRRYRWTYYNHGIKLTKPLFETHLEQRAIQLYQKHIAKQETPTWQPTEHLEYHYRPELLLAFQQALKDCHTVLSKTLVTPPKLQSKVVRTVKQRLDSISSWQCRWPETTASRSR